MKNNFFKALTLCFASAAMSCIVFCGCNKEEAGNSQNGAISPANTPLERLRSFRKQIEDYKTNPEAKGGEAITLDDALWGIENNFNLTYSDAEPYYSQINEHEFSLSISTDGEQQVLVADAANLYEQVITQARNALMSDEFDNKGFISLTVKEVDCNNRGTVITFSGKTGQRTNYNPPIPHVDGPFGTDDNWMYATPLGKCDDPDIPSGADEQLQEQLYIELVEPYVGSDAQHRNIYLDRKRFVFDGSQFEGLYYSSDGEETCIEHEYMNDYYNAEKRIISQIIPTIYHLNGYTPISIEVTGLILENTAFTHRTEVEYGIRTEVSIDEFGEIEDLIIQL